MSENALVTLAKTLASAGYEIISITEVISDYNGSISLKLEVIPIPENKKNENFNQ